MTLGIKDTITMLLDRLNWPIRMARWQAARGFASLLDSSERAVATEAFLEWLASRRMENEIVSGLAALMCADDAHLPPWPTVKAAISKSSILADFLFQKLYGVRLGGWTTAHSGEIPSHFEPTSYFKETIGQAVPSVLETEFRYHERSMDRPFYEQWAWEWQNIMESTGSPHSSYPYHFLHKQGARDGVSVQTSQAQCNVYRSAFLRTLGYAVAAWRMPLDEAVMSAARCLPLSRGLLSVVPTSRPSWLGALPEKCVAEESGFKLAAEQLISTTSRRRMVPVSMRLPIANSVAEFGELLVDAFYVSDDFVPSDQMMEADGARNLWWNINDLVSISGRLPVAPTNEYTVSGRSGSCLPVALNMMPSHFGFWQNDYFHIGLSFPASFNFDSALSVDFGDGSGSFTSGGERVGVWKTWNDDWVPTYPVDGHVRSGVITEVGRRFLDRFAQKSNMRLGWRVTLKVWRAGDYGSHRPMERFAHFVMP